MRKLIIELFNKAKPQNNNNNNKKKKKLTQKKSHEVVAINSQIDLTYLTCRK